MSEELTPWFPGDVKPARPGVYHAWDRELQTAFYCLWDGEFWHYGWRDLESHRTPSRWTNEIWARASRDLGRWRGLAQEPKA